MENTTSVFRRLLAASRYSAADRDRTGDYRLNIHAHMCGAWRIQWMPTNPWTYRGVANTALDHPLTAALSGDTPWRPALLHV